MSRRFSLNGHDGGDDHARFSPPCRAACPTDKNIPGFLRAIAQGDLDEAWRIAYRDNLFPGVLGWICPRPCESACRLAPQGESVPVCELKRWVTTAHAPPPDLRPVMGDGGPDVAIVGAGPAGLAAAHDLRIAGASVTLLDRADRPGGLLNGCIPKFRLPPSVVAADIARILSLGIEFRPGFVLRTPEQLEALRTEGFAAVLLAVGPGDDRPPSLAGWRPGPENRTAITFLRDVRHREVRLDDRRVIVVGGGNGAVDVARVARRLGAADVRVLYRRSRAELPAFPDEIEHAESEGIRIRPHTVVDAVEWKGAALGGVVCSRTRAQPSGGRPAAPRRVAGSEHFVPCDVVVAAIGQKSTLPEGEWRGEDVFRCDAAPRGGTAVSAIASGRQAAGEILRALARSGRWRPSRDDRRRREPAGVFDDSGSASGAEPLANAPSLHRHVAASEAGRCLGCDRLLVLDPERCVACGKCSERCAYDALSWHPAAGGAFRLVIRDEECQRCGDCVAACPSHALRWRPWRRPNRFCALATRESPFAGETSSCASAGDA